MNWFSEPFLAASAEQSAMAKLDENVVALDLFKFPDSLPQFPNLFPQPMA